MKRKLVLAIASVAIIGGCLLAYALASANIDALLGRYPGARRVANEQISFQRLLDGTVTRQGAYRTPDARRAVRRWYMDRLGSDETLDKNNEAGECIWLQTTRLTFRFEHAVVVMMCRQTEGTLVVISESVHLWR